MPEITVEEDGCPAVFQPVWKNMNKKTVAQVKENLYYCTTEMVGPNEKVLYVNTLIIYTT